MGIGRFVSPTFRPSPGLHRHLRIPTGLLECGGRVPTGGLICGERGSRVPTVAASMRPDPPWMG
eukprot:10047462-Alexandrium_andersonii.AAC.1